MKGDRGMGDRKRRIKGSREEDGRNRKGGREERRERGIGIKEGGT